MMLSNVGRDGQYSTLKYCNIRSSSDKKKIPHDNKNILFPLLISLLVCITTKHQNHLDLLLFFLLLEACHATLRNSTGFPTTVFSDNTVPRQRRFDVKQEGK